MDEKRRATRHRTLKTAHITYPDHRGSIDCTIRNLSAIGACLQVVSPIGIPDRFDLMVDSDHSIRPCRIIWRKQTQIGVEFL